ncbi:hypothetical protein CNMCM8980_004573 [Aspergillus fumigatiaffinis]|uniref:Uncharacterized protein n=1 Tax=Aspergillus fumigatiaffinis TaxID=340414 RepID=A0A8H4LYQ7_9EURO|nr:hypothetical protein CNMCM6457_001094 [Aspergillus fumigatiaffinis]KAF4229998.1 hypothetical protein CNMCM6805_001035 [Aspergillus fumigatiaffinis]KAF4249011.1 hypothetical protein CNMCM8980_004573 [Aspergillus fumigatiaffinis]
MDPFSIFPPEVIVSILGSCTDFASLDGLLRTSARADQVFRVYYKAITERVMKNCPIISHGLQYEFRNMVLLESDAIFTPLSLPELLDGAFTTSVVPLSLPPDHSFGAVRKAVSIAASICHAASACIHLLLDRLMVAEPRCVVGSLSKAADWIAGRSSEPQSEPIRMKYHPPSWAETYRTHRILWTLVTFSRVLQAENTRWDWSPEDKTSFTERYVKECWEKWRLEELKTIAECLSVIYPGETITLDRRFPFLVTIPSLEKSPLTAPARLILPTPPKNPAADQDWKQIYWRAGRQNGAIGSYRTLFGVHRSLINHRLQYLNFRAFRRLGIPIWDSWRLYLIGLINQPRDRLCPDSSVFDDLPQGFENSSPSSKLFTWWSLATKEDIDEKFVPEHSPDWCFSL